MIVESKNIVLQIVSTRLHFLKLNGNTAWFMANCATAMNAMEYTWVNSSLDNADTSASSVLITIEKRIQ